MALAIFDLDNTLIAGDSDHLWGTFLAELGIVDGDHYARENDRFYREYREGRLDIHEFLRFALHPLAQHPMGDLVRWRADFLREKIDPIILPAALDLIARHRSTGDLLLIVTATNSFVTAPIAARLGVPNLIATEPQLIGGRYTGEVSGVPSFREGKVQRLSEWLEAHGAEMEGSYCYSDSHNDIPLLEKATHPIAVDPDSELAAYAAAHGWPVISLRPH